MGAHVGIVPIGVLFAFTLVFVIGVGIAIFIMFIISVGVNEAGIVIYSADAISGVVAIIMFRSMLVG